mgnify:FL=1
MDISEKLDLLIEKIDEHFKQIDARLDKIEERLDNVETRLDKIEERLDNVETRLDKIEERLDNVEARLDKIEERLDNVETHLDILEARFDNLEARFDNLETRFDKFEEQNTIGHKELHNRITRLEAENLEQHEKIMEMLNSINSTVIRLETDFSDKISALFDARADFLNHKKTYGHELENIKKVVKNNTFRITSLERKLEQN